MKRLVNITGLAAALAEELPSLTVRYIRILKAERKIPFYKISRKTFLYDPEAVKAAIEKYEVKEVGAK